MYAGRKYSGTGPEMRETRRQLQKLKQKRSDRVLMMIIILGPITLYFAYELSRSVYYMQDAKTFIAGLDRRPPAEVKTDLDRYVPLLLDRNAFVRDGAIACFKAATGWNPGTDGIEWKHMWKEKRDSWEYHPYAPVSPAPKTASWAAELPPAVLHTSGPPPTAVPPPEQ